MEPYQTLDRKSFTQQTRDRNGTKTVPPPTLCRRLGARRPDRVTARRRTHRATAPAPALPHAHGARAHLPNPPFRNPLTRGARPTRPATARAVPVTPSRSSGFTETTFACAGFAPCAHTYTGFAERLRGSTNAIARTRKDRFAKFAGLKPRQKNTANPGLIYSSLYVLISIR